MKNPAGAQAISSRTTIKDWLQKNPSFNPALGGEPFAFGCSICGALDWVTLEDALDHCKSENKTVRSPYWRHDVTLKCKLITGYEVKAEDIIAAAEKQEAQ